MRGPSRTGLVPVEVPAEWLSAGTSNTPRADVTFHPKKGQKVWQVVDLSEPLAALIGSMAVTVAGTASEVLRRLVQLEVTGNGTHAVDALDSLVEAADAPVWAESLTAAQAEVLARAGSLVEELPPVAQRASVRTKLQLRQISRNALTIGEVAALLDVGESRVRQRAANRTLITQRTEKGTRFPRFQFTEDGELPGWDQVAVRFPGDVHPVAVERFMATPNEDLDLDGVPLAPWEWLASGGAAKVVADLVDDVYRIG